MIVLDKFRGGCELVPGRELVHRHYNTCKLSTHTYTLDWNKEVISSLYFICKVNHQMGLHKEMLIILFPCYEKCLLKCRNNLKQIFFILQYSLAFKYHYILNSCISILLSLKKHSNTLFCV